jgi:hypothetical protein
MQIKHTMIGVMHRDKYIVFARCNHSGPRSQTGTLNGNAMSREIIKGGKEPKSKRMALVQILD